MLTLAVLLAACSEDDNPTAAPQTGSIMIDSEPDEITAPWVLVGPSGTPSVGAGDALLSNLVVGDYSISWGSVSQWSSPTPAQVTAILTQDEVLRFDGVYTKNAASLILDVQPPSIPAVWTVTGPEGFVESGVGERTLGSLAQGLYHVEWGAVDCWVTPDPVDLVLEVDQHAIIVVYYEVAGECLPLASMGELGREMLVGNIIRSFETLSYDLYATMIHGQYVFRVDPNDIESVGQFELSAFEDLDSTLKMFNGAVGAERVLDAQGNWTGETVLVPPVRAISLALSPASGSAWTLMPDGQFQGSWRRIYEIDMTVTHSGSARIDVIQGKQVFYLAAGTISSADGELGVWQLRAWEDQGVNSAVFGYDRALTSDAQSMGQLKGTF